MASLLLNIPKHICFYTVSLAFSHTYTLSFPYSRFHSSNASQFMQPPSHIQCQVHNKFLTAQSHLVEFDTCIDLF